MIISYRADPAGVIRSAASSLNELFDRSRSHPPVICTTGGGGKTTVLRHFQDQYLAEGCPSIVMTTTHIQDWDQPFCLRRESREEAGAILERFGRLWVGIPCESGKLGPVSHDFYKYLKSLDLPLLIEADGAKHQPVKVPRASEPVIPAETDRVLWVCGLDCLGKRIIDTACRPELTAALLNKTVEDRLDRRDIVMLALSDRGGRKGVGVRQYGVILNKADDAALREEGDAIARDLAASGVNDVCVTADLAPRREDLD